MAELAAATGTASDTVLLAAFAALLQRYSGHHSVEFMTIRESGRGGPVRFDLSGEATLRALTAEGPATPEGLGENLPVAMRFGVVPAAQKLPFEAELVVPEHREDGSCLLELRYDERLLDHTSAERVLGHYVTLLRDGLGAPDCPSPQLELLDAGEAHRVLVEWNATDMSLPYRDSCLHEAFEAHARNSPDVVAVIQGTTRLSYGEVDTAANRLAHRLRELGVGPEVRVGLFLEHSPDLLVGMLAVLKAGGAYVPLDSAYPPARLLAMIEGASCAVLVSRTEILSTLKEPMGDCSTLLLDREHEILAGQPEHAPVSGVTPSNLCYVIHTSGSTGAPKAIALCHRGVMNNVADLNVRFAIGPGDKVMGLSSPSFDMSVYEFIGMTAAGGTLVLPDLGRTRDPAHWALLAAEHGVTVWNTAPALLELLLAHIESHDADGCSPIDSLRLIMLAGDWIPVGLPDRVRKQAANHRFISLGGATEASIYSTIYEVEDTDPAWTSIPYGRPMWNQRTYILDENLQPVPAGVTGELYLAGTGLAREYLGQPGLTAERFIEWSYGEVTDERLYRTGDLATYNANGLIELLGRADLQVKIHGLRIELTEIETALREHRAVRDAVVLARTDASATPTLVGYAVLRDTAILHEDDLRSFLADRLPTYMLPGTVVLLPELPLSPNGKVDRKALPAPVSHTGRLEQPRGTLPSTPFEKRIAQVWREVLGIETVRLENSFFELGGDSMQAMRAMAIDPAITWSAVYRYPTLLELAQHLADTAGEQTVSEK
ncbi:amino acid adenylation domain-containing protein [Streptomyces globosus]|uniref:non-ribosomal peptide synthetase n=1 Tax=Streptomyces globosus TaxID=68209 RepID=UPI0037FBA5CA